MNTLKLTRVEARVLIDKLLDLGEPNATKLAEVLDDVQGNMPEGARVEIDVGSDQDDD